MLIQFSVGNFLSFKDVVTFSMVASTGKELEQENVFKMDNLRLLKSAAIFGANASGKSNLVKAMNFMKHFIANSSKEMQAGEKINVENYKLSSETEGKPSLFEVIFFHQESKYRYGFETDKSRVQKEWLFYSPKGKETKLFERDGEKYLLGAKFKEGKGLEDKTRSNALFLSVVAQFNGELSQIVLTWFSHFKILSGLDDTGYAGFSRKQLKDQTFKNKMIEFIKIADLGIEDVSLEDETINFENVKFPEDMPDVFKNYFKEQKEKKISTVSTAHKKYDKDNNYISIEKFKLYEDESEGTKKFFAISAPIIDTLTKGYTLVIDEMDSRLHPNLSKFLTKLFNSATTNANNAQLIFAAHDNSLMKKGFRRDQIWFTNKDQYGRSDLYSLFEYRVRKDASFEKDYSLGKYGAVPLLEDPTDLFGDPSNG